MTNRSTSNPLYSALLSAFFNSWSKKSADFFGQRPWVVPHCFAWAQRPTPPLKRRYGTHSFFSVTFFRNRWARRSGIFLIACAASWVFYTKIQRAKQVFIQWMYEKQHSIIFNSVSFYSNKHANSLWIALYWCRAVKLTHRMHIHPHFSWKKKRNFRCTILLTLKWTRRCDPRDLQLLAAFSGSRAYFPILLQIFYLLMGKQEVRMRLDVTCKSLEIYFHLKSTKYVLWSKTNCTHRFETVLNCVFHENFSKLIGI